MFLTKRFISSESESNRLQTSGEIQSDGVESVSCFPFLEQLPFAKIALVPLGQQQGVLKAAAISLEWWSAVEELGSLRQAATALKSIVCRSSNEAEAIGGDEDFLLDVDGGDSSGALGLGERVAKSMPLVMKSFIQNKFSKSWI